MSEPPNTAGDKPGTLPPGALLTDDQVARLRRIVILMTVLLVAGIALLIGRVIYLASGSREQAVAAPLVAEATLIMPEGSTVKSTTLSGNRLLTHYTSPRGEGVLVLDLASGRTLSHVKFSR